MSALQNNTLRYSSLVYVLYAFLMLFRYIGRLVTSQQNSRFIINSLNICWPFGFIRTCAVEIQKFQDSVYLKSENCVHIIKKMKNIETQLTCFFKRYFDFLRTTAEQQHLCIYLCINNMLSCVQRGVILTEHNPTRFSKKNVKIF